MIAPGRFRLTAWVALADFFTAVALFAFALYGVQRQKVIEVEQPVRKFAGALSEALRSAGLRAEYDDVRSRLALPEALLFQTGKWEIRDPAVVAKISRAMLEVRDSLRKEDQAMWGQTRSFHLVIRGHADARPVRGASNLWLSKQRARALEEALLDTGISAPEFHVSSQAVGDSEPKVDNCAPQTAQLRTDCPAGQFASDRALAPNRRIELRFGFFSGS
jgi:outer membrane protein OmpA-like peptidoglycan-associated protein